MKLEDLQANAAVRGVLPEGLATVVGVQWFGSEALEPTYKSPTGKVANQLLYRHDESQLEIVEVGRPWSFDGDGALFRLVSEAQRIRLAHLFDPVLAVHTSVVEPLPHQITAVYESMLPRQPLRFLLADDPGAGKTIMAGLLIKELIARGDLQRCLVVCPGSLAEQWQDELYRRFHLPFEILTNDKLEAARTGNWFLETNLVIARLDKLSRNEDVQDKLQAPDGGWDLIVCDEAHKMSATFFGGEVEYTKRYRLGQLLSSLTRHFLLMTATPHNGKEADFQLFMALIDGDRFEGRFRDGVHAADVSDLMRRMVKERLLKFDGTPLFPERIAYTVPYPLSPAEAGLYQAVTDYVREEFNRAEALENDKRAGTVGFALTILQRRLASSPEAIHRSLRRRRERLESRLRELEVLRRGGRAAVEFAAAGPELDPEDVEDLDEAPENEVLVAEEAILDRATAARSIVELEAEIDTLRRLERLALEVRLSGTDTKWRELASLLGEIFTIGGHPWQVAEPDTPLWRRRDSPAGLVTAAKTGPLYRAPGYAPLPARSHHDLAGTCGVHGTDSRRHGPRGPTRGAGSLPARPARAGAAGDRCRRRRHQPATRAPDGELRPALESQPSGAALRADSPHRSNRSVSPVESRCRRHPRGRRVSKAARQAGAGAPDPGRTGVRCTRQAPLRGTPSAGTTGGGDTLRGATGGASAPHHRARQYARPRQAPGSARRALAQDAMDASRVHRIREDMERAEARRLQPHYVESFFRKAFQSLGGSVRQREPRRYEITHVPAPVRSRDRLIGIGEPVLPRYERIAFDKSLVAPPGQALAAFVCPGHPLLDAVIDLTLERHRDVLKRGAVLVDERDASAVPRVLFYLEHAIQDGSLTRLGERRAISRRMLYVELDAEGAARHMHYAPYLDYRPLAEEDPEPERILDRPECAWIDRAMEQKAQNYAVAKVVPEHLAEVRDAKRALIAKIEAAVKDRLTKEITYWDHRAEQLKAQEQAGKTGARLNSGEARKRADNLQARLHKRLEELRLEARISPLPPVVLGGLLVVPKGLIDAMTGRQSAGVATAVDTQASAARVRNIIMEVERGLGYEPIDREFEKLGYDIESRAPDAGKLRFIEVKGRVSGAATISVTRNEILYSLNKPGDFILELHERMCETPAMANMMVETLSHMYALARGWDIAPESCDPCRSIPMNPKRRRERFLTDAEFTRFGQVLDDVSRKESRISTGAVATIRLLMLTGCRRNEILTLRWRDVDLDAAEIHLADAKTGPRTVHLSPAAARVLAALPRKPGNPWVIPGLKQGTHMTDIDGAWTTIRARAGLHDVRIHDIRHSFASRALALGEGLPIIGRLLGHRRVETTARYAHLARDSIKESAERIAVSIAADIL